MTNLRICLLTDCYPPGIGGIENHVYCLATQLGQLGHSVDVITHRPVNSNVVQQARKLELPLPPANVVVRRSKGMIAHINGADPMIDPRIIGEMRSLMRANGYDVVHGHSLASLLVLAGLREAKQLGVPTLITKHSMTLRPTLPVGISHILLNIETRIAKKWADGLIALSQAAVQEMSAAGLPVYVIPGGVNCEHWRPDPVARRRVRSSLGYREDHVVVGYLARLVPSKGGMSLLRVATRLVQVLPDVRFLFIGDGPMRPQLERRIEELGLQDRITMLGFKPWWETPGYLNAMDIFAFPSYTEACGLALLEAMACGIAPVSRINAGTREIVTNGETGYLITSDEELFQKLLELAQDRGLRNRLGTNAHHAIHKRHSWQAVAERTVEVYREIISRMRGRR
ncbi:MAG: glycosyltransferase family 4 protein [Anaerolineae bacterium]|jgi:glycosyltransferase involved in cell wall biosynthesis|nr:glycosyltransferase family 4 protein [Anaerolineae bacterium]MDH7475566.1 glycosyltransferase family 4 protein [Anaerolineae bacterium]